MDETTRRAALPRGRLVIGREDDEEKPPFGFTPARPVTTPTAAAIVGDAGEGHVLAIAPTGAGKGRNVILPNMLSWEGPAIVIDPKGEAARVSARRRREMGQTVIVLDPFAARREGLGALNPLDTLDPASEDFTADCLAMARTITGGVESLKDPFWDRHAEALIAGLIAYIVEYLPAEHRHLGTLRMMLCESDLTCKLAVILDTTLKDKTGLAVEEIRNFLGHEGDKVRTSVRSTAQMHTLIYAGPKVQASLARSSFSLDMVTRGAPLTIYIVVPPHQLEAYASLLRVWVATLLALITRRTEAPPLPTLFVLDEVAQLGAFPLLKPAITLLRGYGVRCMLLLQDLTQLRGLFRDDHATIVNNCATVLTFGHTSYAMSRDLADLFGDVSAEQLFAMPEGQLAVRCAGRFTRVVGRLDYLTDGMFAGQYDANPMARNDLTR
jgi:type IV secretion system protein VirD4